MNRLVVTVLALLALAIGPARAQRIKTETGERTRIMHLKTELNHLTVIELSEPVVQVAAGSASFKVEWREDKVFVQPTEAAAATNLFVWTAAQRFNYELEPAGSVADMDFAIDQHPAPLVPLKPTTAALSPSSRSDLLLAGQPVRLPFAKQRGSKPVEVWISELHEKDGNLLVRYAVSNHGRQPYAVRMPEVFDVDGGRPPQWLHGLMNSQLSEQQVAKLKIKQQIPVPISEGQIQSQQIAPGERAFGIIALHLPLGTEPRILRFQFPPAPVTTGANQETDIAAFLVH